MKKCTWCSEVMKNNEFLKHTCPNVFIHRISENEITIRGKGLNLFWLDYHVVIGRDNYPHKNHRDTDTGKGDRIRTPESSRAINGDGTVSRPIKKKVKE